MVDGAENFAAFAETTVSLQYFKDMPDSCQIGKMTYSLDNILLLCLRVVSAGCEAFAEIARFDENKLTLLRRFHPFRDGTSAHHYLAIWPTFSTRRLHPRLPARGSRLSAPRRGRIYDLIPRARVPRAAARRQTAPACAACRGCVSAR